MNNLKALYYRVCDLFFFRRFKVFRAVPDRHIYDEKLGLKLVFLSLNEYLDCQGKHGRETGIPAGLNYQAEFHRIAALIDDQDRAVSWGWVSSRLFNRDNHRSDSLVQVPWEAGLYVDLGPNEIYFWSYWTPPEFRRRGYYSTLLSRLRGWCVEHSGSTLVIYCNATNVSSIGGIAKAGFERSDEIGLTRIGPFHLLKSGRDGIRLRVHGQKICLVSDGQQSIKLAADADKNSDRQRPEIVKKGAA